jgi:hypothetical protein
MAKFLSTEQIVHRERQRQQGNEIPCRFAVDQVAGIALPLGTTRIFMVFACAASAVTITARIAIAIAAETLLVLFFLAMSARHW